MRTEGVEPSRELPRQNLNLVRLPIPPRSRLICGVMRGVFAFGDSFRSSGMHSWSGPKLPQLARPRLASVPVYHRAGRVPSAIHDPGLRPGRDVAAEQAVDAGSDAGHDAATDASNDASGSSGCATGATIIAVTGCSSLPSFNPTGAV